MRKRELKNALAVLNGQLEVLERQVCDERAAKSRAQGELAGYRRCLDDHGIATSAARLTARYAEPFNVGTVIVRASDLATPLFDGANQSN